MPENEIITRLNDLAARLDRINERLETALGEPVGGRYMTINQASEHFKLSPQYLYRCREVLVKAGRAVRVDVAKLRKHLEGE